jgi:hypothetical protein
MRLHIGSTQWRETEPEKLDGGKHRLTPHPLGLGNVATIEKCLGN